MPKSKKIEIVSNKGVVTNVTIKKKKKKVKLPPLTGKKISGKGAYSISDIASAVVKPFTDNTPSQSFVNKAARYAGSKLGELTGIPGASEALGNAGSWFARILGMGKYKVIRNSLLHPLPNEMIPQFGENGSLTFSHREYIMDITSSVTFNNQNFLINAGNPLLFPWLSRMASLYEEHEFLGLMFEFRTASATAVGSTNTGLGTLIMATDYDCLDSNYANKQSMEIVDNAVSAAPCYSNYHFIECDPRQNVLKKFFTQNATTLAGYPDDPRFSVLGNFQIATVGVQSASNVGELWVTYHVRLSKPQLAELSSVNNNSWGHIQATCVNAGTPTVNSQTYYPANGGLTMSAIAADSITFAVGNNLGLGSYLFGMRCVNTAAGGSIQWNQFLPIVSGGAVLLPGFQIVGGEAIDSEYAMSGPNITYGANGLPNSASTGMVQIAIVQFPTLTSSVKLQLAFDATRTMKTDVVFAPWNYPSITKPLSEKAQLKAKLDEMYRLINDMRSPQPTENTVNVRDLSLSDVGKDNSTCTNKNRMADNRPSCITISQATEPETPPGSEVFRYVEVARSAPPDTSQLRRN